MRRLVNALVVVLMLAVALGLLLPFVLRVRHAADRIGCESNLRHIQIALHMHHTDFKRLPYARVDDEHMPIQMQPTGLPAEKRLSWQYNLMPYVEAMMDPAWHRGLNKAWDAGDNIFAQQMLPVYLCPRNPEMTWNGRLGLTHYVGIAGIGADAADLPADDPKAGAFGYRRAINWNDIRDGRATTMMVAETATDNGPWAAAGPATVRGLNPAEPPYLGRNGQFSSRHRNGSGFIRPYATNVVFADGSVRSFSPSIDPKVFEAMATIAGGEQIDVVGDD